MLTVIVWWEVALFALLLVLAVAGSWLLRRVLRGQLRRAREAGRSALRIEVLKALVPLLQWGLMIAALAFGLHQFKLPGALESWLDAGLRAAFALLAAHVAGSVVAVSFQHWADAAHDRPEMRSRATLAPVMAKTFRIFFFLLAVLLILQNSGYNVAGLLAGLGIGGLAVALAAKETLANLFGSIAVLMDRPFQVGDLIRQGDIEGKVEKIGLRSTRVRTPDGFLVSIPNQNVTTSDVVNLSARSTRRQVFTIGLVYDLSADQMQEAVGMVREVIMAHAQTADVWVHWKNFGESSLDIQVVYWSKAPSLKEFLDALQDLNCGIKARLDAAGFGFAFPTRTVVLEKS
ncbi:MAG: mechanosensitive ion channel family protein [Akkermansiaceae bacterium]